jgi:hypothetical protein
LTTAQLILFVGFGLGVMAFAFYVIYRGEAMFDEWEKETGYKIIDRQDFVEADALLHKLSKFKVTVKHPDGSKRKAVLTRHLTPFAKGYFQIEWAEDAKP